MKFAVVVFPGSNSDRDAWYAASQVIGEQAELVWHKDTDLGGADAVILRICECRGVETEAALRCARDPVRAVAVDEFGEAQQELEIRGDAVQLHFAPLGMLRVRVEFGPPSAVA